MDTIKARRLLVKIQSFVEQEPGQELSRLERDLLKSYILQLYDAVTADRDGKEKEEKIAPPKLNIQETKFIPEVREEAKQEMKLDEPPPVIIREIPKFEPAPVVEEKIPVHEEIFKPEPKPDPVPVYTTEYKPAAVPVVEEIRETPKPVYPPTAVTHTEPLSEALEKLFDNPLSDVNSGNRIVHVPIVSIEAGLGLNERIFTLNELFGGDRTLFDLTCQRLNQFHSFTEAKQLLMHGAARDFKWGDPQRIKMAEQFIRIVARRYPAS